MINSISLKKINMSLDNGIKEDETKSFNSIFDVHSNGIIDDGDFTSKDLENHFIKDFLNKYLNKNWTVELENLVKSYLTTQNTENFETKLHGYKVKYENNALTFSKIGKTYTIQLIKDSTVTKTDIEKLYNIVKELSPDVLKDFLEEIDAIKLLDETSFGGRGFFEANNIIQLSTEDNNYGVNKYTLIHELGHGVSYRKMHGRKIPQHSFEKPLRERFGTISGINELFKKMQEKFGHFRDPSNTKEYGDGYALINQYEFFAEYYVYKKEGKTGHQSEKMFKALENSTDKDYQDLLKIMEESLKISKKDKNLRKT